MVFVRDWYTFFESGVIHTIWVASVDITQYIRKSVSIQTTNRRSRRHTRSVLFVEMADCWVIEVVAKGSAHPAPDFRILRGTT